MEENKSPEAKEDPKIQFRKGYTAREWLAQQKARVRAIVNEQLPGVFCGLTDESKNSLKVDIPNDLLDLELKLFQDVLKGFSEAYGESETMWDNFLG